MRPHGKWGDLIVCLLPISWCANILSNSNLILRMLEWQSELSLFTIRIRGKQWYWIYKFELKTITDIMTAPKNVGHNKWIISVFNDLKIADDYLHVAQLRSQNNWIKVYWNDVFERTLKHPNMYKSSPQDLLFIEQKSQNNNFLVDQEMFSTKLQIQPNLKKKKILLFWYFLSYRGDKWKKNQISYSRKFQTLNNLDRVVVNATKLSAICPQCIIASGLKTPIISAIKEWVANGNFTSFHGPTNSNIKKFIFKLSVQNIFSKVDWNILSKLQYNQNLQKSRFNIFKFYGLDELFITKSYTIQNFTNLLNCLYNFSENSQNNKYLYNFNHSEYNEVNRWVKKSDTIKMPLRLIKNPLKFFNFSESSLNTEISNNLFQLKFNDTSELLHHKKVPLTNYLTLKQKRYTRRERIVSKLAESNITFKKNNKNSNFFFETEILSRSFQELTSFNKTIVIDFLKLLIVENFEIFKKLILVKNKTLTQNELNQILNFKNLEIFFKDKLFCSSEFSDDLKYNQPSLWGNKIILENFGNAMFKYKVLKNNRIYNENIPITLARRLLRTKRTIVLPIYVNLSVITNSYDVVHSWFIPGLSLKFDCIPGRSTHHLLHIENIGFYYGQCAEICGRYHHHMPIRLCALPFEHFLVWWNTIGLPRLLRYEFDKFKHPEYTTQKYAW